LLSKIIYLYPIDFEQDFICKDKYWKGIPQLPPLDVDLVNKVYKAYNKKIIHEPIIHKEFYNK
jgi:hypothetical protein